MLHIFMSLIFILLYLGRNMNCAPGTPRQALPPSPAIKETKRMRKESGARFTDIIDPTKVTF